MGLYIVLLSAVVGSAQAPSHYFVFSAGLDYRPESIDIEDLPQGPLPTSYTEFYGGDFWKTLSVHGRWAVALKKNWQFSIAGYSRYNHLNWLERGKDEQIPWEWQHLEEQKRLKFDCFLEAEKKFRIKKTKERYLTIMAGLGFVNLNTHYNVFFKKDTLPSGIIRGDAHYEGNLAKFAPKLSLGYQYKRIKATIDAYVVEGQDLVDLTAAWIGATISYEILIRKKE